MHGLEFMTRLCVKDLGLGHTYIGGMAVIPSVAGVWVFNWRWKLNGLCFLLLLFIARWYWMLTGKFILHRSVSACLPGIVISVSAQGNPHCISNNFNTMALDVFKIINHYFTPLWIWSVRWVGFISPKEPPHQCSSFEPGMEPLPVLSCQFVEHCKELCASFPWWLFLTLVR